MPKSPPLPWLLAAWLLNGCAVRPTAFVGPTSSSYLTLVAPAAAVGNGPRHSSYDLPATSQYAPERRPARLPRLLRATRPVRPAVTAARLPLPATATPARRRPLRSSGRQVAAPRPAPHLDISPRKRRLLVLAIALCLAYVIGLVLTTVKFGSGFLGPGALILVAIVATMWLLFMLHSPGRLGSSGFWPDGFGLSQRGRRGTEPQCHEQQAGRKGMR